MHSTTPGIDSRMPRSTAPLLPVMPMAVRPAPGMGWAFRPRDSILSQTERTCSSVALDCMTTSISCVLWERGMISVLKRNEWGQIRLGKLENRKKKERKEKKRKEKKGKERKR